MNSTLEVGKKLVEYCRNKKFLQAVDALYAPNIVSLEAMSMPNHPARVEGLSAVRGKAEWWEKNHDIHGCECMGPFPNGDRFIVHMTVDVTSKTGPMAGKRMKMDEGCLYTVKDGKIVQEEFFYSM